MDEPLAFPFHGLDNIDRNFSMAFGVDGVPGQTSELTRIRVLCKVLDRCFYCSGECLPLQNIVKCIRFRELLQSRVTEYML